MAENSPEAGYSRELDALYDALAEVVPAMQLQEDYQTLLESLSEWPHLEQFFLSDGQDPDECLSAATWDAIRRAPAVREAIEAIRATERTFWAWLY